MRLAGLSGKEAELRDLLAELDGYRALYERLTGRPFREARIFEVGYGARPLRLLALISMGLDARGIDLDAPLLRRTAGDLFRILQANGPLRFVKSAVRGLVFDAHERRALGRVLRQRGAELKIEPERFGVGDMSTTAISPGSIDFIYSEDVFEHVPGESMNAMCLGMARALSLDGLAVISPSVYSGITGGHLVEWYSHTLNNEQARRSEPWEHLRQRRFKADCFLNELRVSDFRTSFEECFDVVAINNMSPGLGRSFLTPSIQAELAGYNEDELLCDKWQFVLRRKR